MEQELRRAGIDFVLADGGLILPEIPAGLTRQGIASTEGFLILTNGDPEPLARAHAPDALLVETGTLGMGEKTLPAYRFVLPSALRPASQKLGEPQGNLARRAKWFQSKR